MEQQTHILVVEDEAAIRTALTDFLEFHGFRVSQAADGRQARQRVAREVFDLILLDLMLPEIGGEELCTLWRRDGVQTPIIMVTAKGQEKDKIMGLDLGADDYITKPFSLEEMLARIRAVLRRTDPARAVGQTFAFGDLAIDMAALKATRDGRDIDISKREAGIIQYFAANPNRVVGREELYREVWQDTLTDLGTRTVDMHIAKLRAKIEPDSAEPKIIQTVRGAGYRYECGKQEGTM
ncbi:MAG: response regulator transcription factor [Sedimentisphaerales bacterium]|nr:response regulator transcription factor [Sedimentisphaerales bacterium]